MERQASIRNHVADDVSASEHGNRLWRHFNSNETGRNTVNRGVPTTQTSMHGVHLTDSPSVPTPTWQAPDPWPPVTSTHRVPLASKNVNTPNQ